MTAALAAQGEYPLSTALYAGTAVYLTRLLSSLISRCWAYGVFCLNLGAG